MMLFHENFNRRFDHIPVLAPFRDFPKIVAAFFLFLSGNTKDLNWGWGQMIFPYRRNDKKMKFFSGTRSN
jgi:hypothetical protein